jgi:hypothetical protein
MELFDNLASMGFTTKVLQVIILLGIIIFFLGKYWKHIAVGAGVLFCVVVFAMPTTKSDKVGTVIEDRTVVPVVPQDYKIEPMPVEPPVVEIKPEPKVAETKELSDERMFLEDCNLYSGYTPSQCKALWESDKAEIMKSNWKFNKNKAKMVKVKYVL